MTYTPFPSKEKFLKECAEAKKEDVIDVKRELYDGYAEPSTMWDIIGDHTSDNISEDEVEWLNQLSPKELWELILDDAIFWFEKEIRKKVPIETVLNHVDKDTIEEYKKLKDMKLLNKI